MAAAVDDVFFLDPPPFPPPFLLRRLPLEDESETRPSTAAPANAKSTAEPFLVFRWPLPREESSPGAAAAATEEDDAAEEEGKEEALALRALA